MTFSRQFDIQKVTQLIQPVIDEMGFELIDIEYVSERGRWVLRIYVDKAGGITLDECVLVSREVGDLIDIKDVIQHEYVLEVSSPGLNRPLKRAPDFLSAIGKKIKVKMIAPVNGRIRFKGYLKKYEHGNLHLDVEKKLFVLPQKDVEKANLIYEF